MYLLRKGDFNKVPLILGTNRDGGSYIGAATPLAYGSFPFLENDLGKMARWLLENTTDRAEFVKLYGESGGFWRKRLTLDRVFRDSFFQCSNLPLHVRLQRLWPA